MARRTADEYKDILKYSFMKNRGDFERMQGLQRLYDNTINEEVWPTESHIPLAYLFTAVHDMLPYFMDYCFPDLPVAQLVPREAEVSVDQVRDFEWYLHDTVLNRMDLKRTGYPTLQNCLKLGVGIGMIEPSYITPLQKYILPQSEEVMIAPGTSEKVLRYRNLDPSTIIAYPDGSDFNGHDSVSMSFLLDYYHEEDIRAMHRTQPDSLKKKWDPEKVITKARNHTYDIGDDFEQFIMKISGKRFVTGDGRKHIPVNVPVLKVYEPHRHVWFACGEDLIFDTETTMQTFRVPLVKASAWPDGSRFYPMSVPDALKQPAFAYNIWVNLVFDLMTWSAKRPFLYNSDMIEDPEFGPDGKIKCTSTDDVRKAGAWMEPPGVGNDTMAVGEKLQQICSDISGHKDFTSRNFTRGGMGAFSELLKTMGGREKLASSVLATGWEQDVYTHTMIHIQNNVTKDTRTIIDYNNEGKKYFKQLTVTAEELKNVYDLSIDARGISELSLSFPERNQMYLTYKDDPMVNPFELRKICTGSETVFRKLWKSKDEMDAMQEEERRMQMEERRNGIEKASGGPEQTGQVGANTAEPGTGAQG